MSLGISCSRGDPVDAVPSGVIPGTPGCRCLGVLPGLDQPLRQVAAGLDEERPRAARHVADLEIEQFLGRPQRPLLLRLPLGRADVDQWLQRVLDDRLGQARRACSACRWSADPSRP